MIRKKQQHILWVKKKLIKQKFKKWNGKIRQAVSFLLYDVSHIYNENMCGHVNIHNSIKNIYLLMFTSFIANGFLAVNLDF